MADDISGAAFQSRTLARAARAASLATVVDGGQPFVTLVTPACAADFSFLLLLSDLSEHTRHLRAEPRCALLFMGETPGDNGGTRGAGSANPQTAPRVTITGIAGIADEPALRTRYLAVHPYAALYAGFGDFHLWRIRPLGGLYVGGFARAVRLRAGDLQPAPAAVAALAAAQGGIIRDHEAAHPDAAALLAGETGAWRLAGVDTDGADLALGETTARRISWSAPVVDAAGAHAELARLTREARSGNTPLSGNTGART